MFGDVRLIDLSVPLEHQLARLGGLQAGGRTGADQGVSNILLGKLQRKGAGDRPVGGDGQHERHG
jgi:hypothetical protein